ncbi:MAG: metallophosphoesterase [Gammaproteobacteria bacterium]|nr:metallophosphoesterase [Gammaproteobacteria bacterium]
MRQEQQDPRPGSTSFIHITDMHLLDHPDEKFHGLNTRSSLERVLSQGLSRYPDIDFLLFTGDISQTENGQSYDIFQSIIQQYHLPVYCVPGNHDSPRLLQNLIPSSPNEAISIINFSSFSLVLVNSRVVGQNYGKISPRCLQQLQEHLHLNQHQMTIVAIHHPPLKTNSKWLDDLGLQNQTEFLRIINKHPGNTLVLSGHVHQEIDYQRGKLRILTTPSTCHQFEANCDHMNRTNTPPAYRYIRLTASHNIETRVHYVDQEWNQENSPNIMDTRESIEC